jgi:hypothetical protein
MCGYDWTTANSKQVAYLAADSHIYEIFQVFGQNTLGHIDLTGKTGAPEVESTIITGFNWPAAKSKHVLFVDDAGHIHEMSCTDHWKPAVDLMSDAGSVLGKCASGERSKSTLLFRRKPMTSRVVAHI